MTNKQLYDLRIKEVTCVICGEMPINTDRSVRACTACLDVLKVRDAVRYAEGRKVISPEGRREYKLKSQAGGFCTVHTGRKRDGASRWYCAECLARKAAKQAVRRGASPSTGNRAIKTKAHGKLWRAWVGRGKKVEGMWGESEEQAVERLKRRLEMLAGRKS